VEGFATHVVLSNHYNTVQSDITVGANSTLEITGHIGVVAETFDLNTIYATSYYHGRYSGTIDIKAGGVVDLATQSGGTYHADYQRLGGELIGTGTLVKSGPMPVYYTGAADRFEGETRVTGGAFNLGANVVYGAASARKFTVHAEGMLGSGAGSVLRTSSFVMHSGSTLVLNLGTFAIHTPKGGAELGVGTGGVLNLRVLLGAGDADSGAGGGGAGGAAAKLSFKDSDGVTFASGAGVLIPGMLNVKIEAKGYYPKPMVEVDGKLVGDKFTLIEGLDFLPGKDAVAASHEQLNITDAEKVWNETANAWELQIMRSGFFAYYDNEGNLILEQYSHIHVPEPSTYALCAAALLLSLTLFRPRRNHRPPATARRTGNAGL
jgi:hypothetical protein